MWRKNRVGTLFLHVPLGTLLEIKHFSLNYLFPLQNKQFPTQKHLHIFKNLYQPKRAGPLINWSWQICLAFFTCTLKSIVVIDYYLISSFHCLRHLRKQVPSINISASCSFSSAKTNSYASWGAKLKVKILDKFGFVAINISESQIKFLSAFIMTDVFLYFGRSCDHHHIHSQTVSIFLVRGWMLYKAKF